MFFVEGGLQFPSFFIAYICVMSKLGKRILQGLNDIREGRCTIICRKDIDNGVSEMLKADFYKLDKKNYKKDIRRILRSLD